MNGVLRLPRLVGFVGKKGAGKDTAAECLVYMYRYRVVKLAGPIKAMLRALLKYRGMSDSEADYVLDGDGKNSAHHYLGGRTARHAMQTLGTEWGREMIHPSLWLAAFDAEMNRHPLVVCTDVRFQNEVDQIRRLSGVVIRIDRPDMDDGDVHASEVEINALPVDYIVTNDGSIKDLHDNVMAAIRVTGATTQIDYRVL